MLLIKLIKSFPRENMIGTKISDLFEASVVR